MYIDTSVLVAYYSPERFSKKAQKLLQLTESPMISWLTETEFSSAIAKKVRTKMLSIHSAHLLLETFRQHIEEGYFDVLELNYEHYMKAKHWLSTLEHSLTTLDALHLALALEAGTSLITADKLLAKNANRLGVKATLVK